MEQIICCAFHLHWHEEDGRHEMGLGEKWVCTGGKLRKTWTYKTSVVKTGMFLKQARACDCRLLYTWF